MIDRLFSNEMMAIVQKALDASSLQSRVIANNLANVDTPGFKRSEVLFKEKLKAAMDSRQEADSDLQAALTDPAHIAFSETATVDSVRPSILTRADTSFRNDKNNVDIDAEMAHLSENTIYYNALTQLTQMHFSEIKEAILEGRR
jgi:flagellar basal-body rod protein FlgB